ncbi:hypothetical protein [Mesorhizobium sp. CO1-1-11]|uniref:hypothetical protein n=1 Tax=Mesorhizobium sp. CO1-1-11 TaxID=2876636 RepID=UPI00398D33BC
MTMTNESEPSLSLLALQDASLDAVTVIRDEIQFIFENNPEKGPFSQTVYGLVKLMGDRSQSTLMLTSWSMPWDAEIVLRAFYEAAAKVLLLTMSPNGQREKLLTEFWDDFDSIHTVRRARKAALALGTPGESESDRDVFEALINPNYNDLSHRHNKAARKAIEQRWSFSEIIETLSRLGVGKDVRHATSLLHMYGMASHFVHSDKTALDLAHDRITRPEPERSIVAAAQAARIHSDIVHLWFLCTDTISRALGVPFSDAAIVVAAVQKVERLGRPFIVLFEDSQKAFYQGLREKYASKRTEVDR